MRRSTFAALALAILAGPQILADAGDAKPVAANLTLPGIMKIFAKGSSFVVAIPLTFVFDAQGGRVAEISGYGPETLSQIEKALAKTAPAGAPRIEDLVLFLNRPDDTPMKLADVPRGAAVIAEFGAAWCSPCRRLKPEVARIAKESAAPVVVLEIDADIRRVSQDKLREVQKAKQ